MHTLASYNKTIDNRGTVKTDCKGQIGDTAKNKRKRNGKKIGGK